MKPEANAAGLLSVSCYAFRSDNPRRLQLIAVGVTSVGGGPDYYRSGSFRGASSVCGTSNSSKYLHTRICIH